MSLLPRVGFFFKHTNTDTDRQTHTHACMHVCTHTHTQRTNKHTHTCIFAHCIHTHMYTHKHTYTHTHDTVGRIADLADFFQGFLQDVLEEHSVLEAKTPHLVHETQWGDDLQLTQLVADH